MRMRRLRARGFSLAEIILVIAVGTILLWSGTMMYLNAKDSAGMSRARDKVLALQQVVEQMATNLGGTYPEMHQVAMVWKEKRKGDIASSPWGGKVGRGFDPAAAKGVNDTDGPYDGITGRGGTAASGYTAAYRDLAPGVYPSSDAIYGDPSGTGSVGGLLEYRRISADTSSVATGSFFDTSINNLVDVRAYEINIRDNKGKVLFVNGAAPPPR